jgi:hypothetical protein
LLLRVPPSARSLGLFLQYHFLTFDAKGNKGIGSVEYLSLASGAYHAELAVNNVNLSEVASRKGANLQC